MSVLLGAVFLTGLSIWSEAKSEMKELVVNEKENVPVGYHLTDTTIKTINALQQKNAGYLSNDIMMPFVFLDNMPAWEFGVLTQIREIALSYRNGLSRSKSQSTEDKNLVEFQTLMNNDSEKWALPASEGKYKDATKYLHKYMEHLMDDDPETGLFYARADNLAETLKLMNKRLGSLSQRLSASVGQIRKNTDLAGDASATQAKDAGSYVITKTKWLEIDDVFYEARGTTWALIALLKAIKIDFDSVLKDKNATQSIVQVIRELEVTQNSITSPMILNGDEFGLLPNYSIAMSSYVTRANAGIIDLINLLENG
ncbi:hypothetical protein A3715_11465 [Oleiphilus sp. HI0009]|nr:hypothetical protein A3715_11465 [Oleiphilus sp. HI0009]